MVEEKNRVYRVAELNAAARRLLEQGLPLLWVRGEISNFVSAASGHWYFSLKDEAAQVRCVMFRHKSQYLDFRPANGQQVEVQALATLYEARGDFQLNLESMRPAGQGALYEAFARLKKKLEREGLFDAARKRKLPLLPRQIGIVTSPQAAALRDVLRTLAHRMPGVPIVLYPTPVQGEGAATKIAQAIQQANARAECEVLIVCRGGGSIEDLWAFNEEIVARAIAASELPVVSGVGHETDFTIADFVADLRAATPTAAAQAVVPARHELWQRLATEARHLQRGWQRRQENVMQRLDFLQRRLVHPAQRIVQKVAQLAALRQRLQAAGALIGQRAGWRVQSLCQRLAGSRPQTGHLWQQLMVHARALHGGTQHLFELQRARIDHLARHLEHLDPQQVLARGYSLVRDRDGRLVTASTQVAIGEGVRITLAHGWLDAEVRQRDAEDAWETLDESASGMKRKAH